MLDVSLWQKCIVRLGIPQKHITPCFRVAGADVQASKGISPAPPRVLIPRQINEGFYIPAHLTWTLKRRGCRGQSRWSPVLGSMLSIFRVHVLVCRGSLTGRMGTLSQATRHPLAARSHLQTLPSPAVDMRRPTSCDRPCCIDRIWGQQTNFPYGSTYKRRTY